jgi:hypothetical protein
VLRNKRGARRSSSKLDLPVGRPATTGKRHGTSALGPSDISDSGSDLQGAGDDGGEPGGVITPTGCSIGDANVDSDSDPHGTELRQGAKGRVHRSQQPCVGLGVAASAGLRWRAVAAHKRLVRHGPRQRPLDLGPAVAAGRPEVAQHHRLIGARQMRVTDAPHHRAKCP